MKRSRGWRRSGLMKSTIVGYTSKSNVNMKKNIGDFMVSNPLPNDMIGQVTKEFTNDAQEDIAKGAIKYDGGKAPIYRGAVSYFPRAISAVAAVSAFGASKYAWKGWEGVPDGFNRYSDALVRHLTYEGTGEVLDPDSGLLHAAHTCWNSNARLELLLKEIERVGGVKEYLKSLP